MSKWYEYDAFMMTVNAFILPDTYGHRLMKERGKQGWKLAYCIPIVPTEEDEDPNRFTIIFEREHESIEQAAG